MSRKTNKRSDFGSKLLARKGRVPARTLKPLTKGVPLGSRLAARFARLGLKEDIPALVLHRHGETKVLTRYTISLTPEDSTEIERRAAQIGLSVPHTIEAMLRGFLNLTRRKRQTKGTR